LIYEQVVKLTEYSGSYPWLLDKKLVFIKILRKTKDGKNESYNKKLAKMKIKCYYSINKHKIKTEMYKK
jgi:hypothetical protein